MSSDFIAKCKCCPYLECFVQCLSWLPNFWLTIFCISSRFWLLLLTYSNNEPLRWVSVNRSSSGCICDLQIAPERKFSFRLKNWITWHELARLCFASTWFYKCFWLQCYYFFSSFVELWLRTFYNWTNSIKHKL